MLLEGKKLLITGVLSPQSIAFAVARLAQEQGAEVLLTGVGKGLQLTEMSARRLPDPPDVLEMDANDEDQINAVAAEVGARFGRLDGFLHAIAYAPPDALGGDFVNTPWESVAMAVRTRAFSLKAIAVALPPHLKGGGAIGGPGFAGSVAWPL